MIPSLIVPIITHEPPVGIAVFREPSGAWIGRNDIAEDDKDDHD